jgi:hypothetical protein
VFVGRISCGYDRIVVGSCVATKGVVDPDLPGLPASAPKPAGLGSTGRTTPGNLTEQLAMTEVRSALAVHRSSGS